MPDRARGKSTAIGRAPWRADARSCRAPAFRGVERNCWFLLYRLRSRRCHSAGRFYFGSCCIARLRLLGGDGAPSRKAAPRHAAGQLRELSFVLKGRFCAGWTNQAIEIIASWHISRAHHLAASAGTFTNSIANAVSARSRRRGAAQSSWNILTRQALLCFRRQPCEQSFLSYSRWP